MACNHYWREIATFTEVDGSLTMFVECLNCDKELEIKNAVIGAEL